MNSFYKYVNDKLDLKNNIFSLRDNSGQITTEPKVVGDLFNDFFSLVFIQDNGQLPTFEVSNNQGSLSYLNIDHHDIMESLGKLKSSYSSGPDGIPPFVIKKLLLGLVEPLLRLFNLSLSIGSVPDEWRMAFVIPLFKKGDRSLSSNYRPISLTCVICKVLERIICAYLLNYLLTHGFVSNNQFGFLKRRSTILSLLKYLNFFLKNRDHKLPVNAVYIDFRKAFDSVSHKKLLFKLRASGISGKLFLWFESFLTKRMQVVLVDRIVSNAKPVLSGVIQGSVLGPLLFLIYIMDIDNCIVSPSNSLLFTDDMKLFCSETDSASITHKKCQGGVKTGNLV